MVSFKTEHTYYRTRYYDPYSQKFLSEDPIGFLGGDINLYRYVRNHPLSEADPSGNGPVSGAACFIVDVGYNMSTSLAEWSANNQIAEAYEFAIKNTEKELNERCKDDSVRRGKLKKELLVLQVKRTEAQLKASKALLEGIGGTAVGATVCGGLLSIPMIP